MSRIVVGFDGSCPHHPDGISEEGPNRFRIFPSWRSSTGISEEAVGRSTRLGLKIVNESPEPEQVELLVDWQYNDAPPDNRPSFPSCAEFMSFRDFIVVRGPGETAWRTVMGDVDEAVAAYRLTVPPDETEVHWHPPYNYVQSEAFVESLRERPFVTVDKIGESEERRNLWRLTITDESTRRKTPAMIRARVHAYESGGSYAMEGMVHWLLSDDPWAVAARRRYVFHIIPMSNPDGVHNGLGRLTSPQGADLVWNQSAGDSAHQPILDVAADVQPKLFIDLHNWQNKHMDGLLGLDREIRERFVRFMPDQVEFGKEWLIREPPALGGGAPEKETLGSHCRRVFGAVSVSFEFPWFGRTVDDARLTGRRALRALLRAMDEPPESLRTR